MPRDHPSRVLQALLGQACFRPRDESGGATCAVRGPRLKACARYGGSRQRGRAGPSPTAPPGGTTQPHPSQACSPSLFPLSLCAVPWKKGPSTLKWELGPQRQALQSSPFTSVQFFWPH